jgi:hypothetical protein
VFGLLFSYPWSRTSALTSLLTHLTLCTPSFPASQVEYDENRHAFVRQFVDNGSGDASRATLTYIPATDYAIETSVKGTNINYTELNAVASKPFQEKCEWLKMQFNAIKVPW